MLSKWWLMLCIHAITWSNGLIFISYATWIWISHELYSLIFQKFSNFIVFQKESDEDQLQVINTLFRFLIFLQYMRPVNLIVVLGNVVRNTNISMADCWPHHGFPSLIGFALFETVRVFLMNRYNFVLVC